MWKAKIIDNFCTLSHELYIYRDRLDGGVDVMGAGGASGTSYPQGAEIKACTLLLPDNALQGLLNALLEKGIKPKEQSRVEGMLEATKVHLEDMRRLVFKEQKK